MTTNNYLITPPPELVREWAKECSLYDVPADHIATQAARWGADQELEACCEWVSQWRCMVGGSRPEVGLRAARRPKLPSLKEQALEILGYPKDFWSEDEVDTIRRALEQLDD